MITFPWGMSQRAGNARPRPPGPRECGSAARGSPWKRLVAFLVATPQNRAGGPAHAKINFDPLPGTLLRLEQFVRGGQGLLKAVWSRREASCFRRWLTERDDASAEALAPPLPTASLYAALLTLLSMSGHHQSHSPSEYSQNKRGR